MNSSSLEHPSCQACTMARHVGRPGCSVHYPPDDDAHELEVRRRAAQLREKTRTESEHFAQVMAERRARNVVDPAAPLATGRSFALASIKPGWVLYAKNLHWAGEDIEYPGQAGTVLEVVHRRNEDTETGEVIEETSYRCLATWRLTRPYAVIDAGDVDTDQLGGIDRRAVAVAVRWLVRTIASGDGLLNAKDRERIIDAWRLVVTT